MLSPVGSLPGPSRSTDEGTDDHNGIAEFATRLGIAVGPPEAPSAPTPNIGSDEWRLHIVKHHVASKKYAVSQD